MSDQINLTGPDANVSNDEINVESNKAINLDGSSFEEMAAIMFVHEPAKTLDTMTDEEILIHYYTMEAFIRKARIHLYRTHQAKEKRQREKGKKVFDQLDANYKPKPVPQSKQATDAAMKLALRIQELKSDMGIELSIEECLKLVRED